MTAVLPVIAAGGVLYAAARVHRGLSRSWLAVLAHRWFTGHSLDGRHRTNATWLARSTETLHPHRVVRWHHLPRAWRAVIRTGVTAAAVAAPAGYVTHPAATLTALAVAAAAAGGVSGWVAWGKLRHARHQWRYVRPLRRALTPVLEGAPPRLEITSDRSQAKIWLPPEFIGTDKEWGLVLAAVTAKLGIEAPERSVQLQGARPYVVYSRSEPPPPVVRSRDILSAVRDAAEHEIILGIGKKDQVIDLSLDTEIPHIGFCMPSGDGKSMAALNASVQVLHHGGLAVFLDYKLMSHMWARGLPNVAYAGTPAELHEILCWLANDDEAESELTRRKKVALASADIRGNVRADIGPRILVVGEELNVTQKILKSHWRRMGGKGPSPAAEALEEIHFTGRQLRIHALDIGQRLSAKATSSSGSGDSRENIGAILFSNPSASTWKMLCDGHVQPPATDHRGRYQLVTRKTVRELQGALWDEEAARVFATAGTVAVPRHDMPFITPQRLPVLAGTPMLGPGCDQGVDLGHAIPGPARPPGSVLLSEAAAAGLFVSVDAARKAAQRGQCGDPVGRAGTAHLYSLQAIYDYRAEKAMVTR